MIIKKAPDQGFAYIGKAIALVNNINNLPLNDLFDVILKIKENNAVQKNDDVEELINLSCDKDGTTLLMYPCLMGRFDVFEILVNMGADINIKSNFGVTALWYVSRKELPEDNIYERRQIAKVLIEMGADIDVKNKGGVALYNKSTDAEIARMIRQKHPEATMGDTAAGSKKKTGCYIATCVYGSYDCPEVWALRRFRDNTLATSWYGRVFIRTYYAISPAIVKWFGENVWFKKLWRVTLDRIVKRLKAIGVESTPYKDIEW